MAIQYCHNLEFVVSGNKTQQLILGRQRDNTEALLGRGKNVYTKYPGVTFDEKLTCTPHVDALCREHSVGEYVIVSMTRISDMTTSKITYCALLDTGLQDGVALLQITCNAKTSHRNPLNL